MLNKEELLNKAKQTVISKEKNKPLITKEELMNKAYTKRAATQNDINLINNVFSSAKNYANVIKNVSYGNVGEVKQQRQTLLNQVKVAKNTLKFLDIDQVEKDKLNKDIDDILTGLDDDISLLDEAEKMYAQFGSEEEYNQAVEFVNFASDEKKAEIENKKKQQKAMADIIDRYERSKYENYNIDPLKETPVAGPQGVIKELANNGLIFDDLQIENGDVAKFEEKLKQKYEDLSGEIASYEGTMRAIEFEKKVQEYKTKFTDDGTIKAWQNDGAKDYTFGVAYSGEMTDDESKVYNALAYRAGQEFFYETDTGVPAVSDGKYIKSYQKQIEHNYSDKDIAKDLKISVDEWKKIKSDVKAFIDYSTYLEDAVAQRKGTKVSEALKGKTILQELYSLWSGVNNWGTGISAAITGDTKPNATQYASAMVRYDLVKNNGVWGSLYGMLYDAGTSTGQMLPSIALAYATGGTATAFGASAKTAQLVSNLTFKTTFGAAAYGNAYTEMINSGYNENQAKAFATLSASSEVLLQDLLGGIGKFSGKLTNASITKAISNIDNAFMKIITTTAIEAGGEFTEEALQEIISPIFKALVTGDVDPIKWGDVIYAGVLGAFTSFASNAPSATIDTTRNIVKAIDKSGFSLTQKGVKNLAAANDIYDFAITMPEYTTSFKLANVVRKGGNAYNMLSELAYQKKPLTEAQSTELRKRLVDDGYSVEIANDIVNSAVKVSKGISVLNAQKQAIESNPILTNALLDTMTEQDAKTLGVTEEYNKRSEAPTVSRNAVYDKITQKTPQAAENAQTEVSTKKVAPKGREVLKAPKHSPVHKISDTVYKTTEAGKLSAEQTSKDEEVIKKICKRIGYDVEFVNKDFVENGHTVPGKIDHENKKIFINRDAKKSIEWLTRHEVTHSTEAKKSYGKFIKQIKKTAVYKDWLRLKSQSNNTIQEMEAAIRNSKRKNYAAQNEALSVTDADYELFADFVADMLFNEEDGIDRLLNELDKPTRTKFVEWILDILDSFKAVFSEEARQLQEIKRLEKKFASLLTETKTIGKKTDNSIDKNTKIEYNITRGENDGRQENTSGRNAGISGQTFTSADSRVEKRFSALDGRKNYRGIGSTLKNILLKKGATPVELKQINSAESFYGAIAKAKINNSHGAFVTQYEVSDYQQNMLFLSEDNNVGVAVTPDGDIISVFKNPDYKGKKAVSSILLTALENGGVKLDNFNGGLSRMYWQHGFIPVARTKFVREFAPDDWNYERDGEPDIIFWMHNGDSAENVANKIGDYGEIPDLTKLPLMEYEKAAEYRNKLIKNNKTRQHGAQYSLEEDGYAPIFYSKMGKVVEAIKQDKLGASSVIPMLTGKGVKAEEIRWSGIQAFLEGKKSVTKQELLEFINGSMLQIEEATRDNREIPYSKEHLKQIAEYEAERDTIVENLKSEWKRIVGTDIPISYFGAGLESVVVSKLVEADATVKDNTEVGYKYKAAFASLRNLIENSSDYFGYDNGRQAFQEAVRIPKEFMSSFEMTSFEEGVFHDFIKAKEAYKKLEGIPLQEQRALKTIAESADRVSSRILRVKDEHRAEEAKHVTEWNQFKLNGGKNYREIVFTMSNSSYSNQMMRTHWGEDAEGVLAHARIQDFEVNGKKMLFIEEIQSDWHNEGHKSGYKEDSFGGESIEEYAAKKVKSIYGEELWRSFDDGSLGRISIKLFNEVNRIYEEAAIEWKKKNEAPPDAPFKDTYHEFVLKRLLRMAAEQGYDSIGWTPADIQSKRWSDEYAEGYRIEYDQDMPKFLNKYGKQWGAKVGFTTLKNGNEVWSMDITDTMRNSVLYEGQPQYSLEENETRPLKAIIADIGNGKLVSSGATQAYNNGYMPKSLWTKEMFVYAIHEINPNINVAEMPLEKLQTYLEKKGTFETGKIPRQTDFYGIDTEVVKNLTQLKVDNFITNTEDLTLKKQSINPSNKASEYADRVDELGRKLRGQEITLEDYKKAVDDLYKEAGQKHGTIKQGEMVTGDEDFSNPVPQKVGKGMPTRQFVRTSMEATPEDIRDILTPAQEAEILKGEESYVRTSNKTNIEKALKRIADGEDYKIWNNKINNGSLLTADDIAVGELLLEGAFEKKDAGMALKLIAQLSEVGTRLGQAVQALSLLKRMGGLGKLLYVQQTVKTINKDLEKKAFIPKNAPKVKIKEELAVQLADAKTESDFAIAYEDILKDIASQIPSTWEDKFNAWRYMAMLANPTTVIRNFFGNVIFMPVVMTSELISKTIESAGTAFTKNRNNRSKSFTIGKEYKDFASQNWQENKKAIMSGGKYNISSEINDYRTIFKTKALESVRKASGWALDNKWFGDEAFVGNYYRHALSQFLAARKVDLNKVSKETLSEAQEYAIKTALKNTYRDSSAVAQFLTNLARQPYGFLVEGILPFKKTPVNILKRGVEYSPIGYLTTIAKMLNDAIKGELKGYEIIEGFANATTGTGLFVLGMWLSALGVASAGFDDEDELWRKLNGEQSFSLKFGDWSYTFDWMAPAAIPFFMGTAMYEDIQRNSNGQKGIPEILTSSIAAALDVITETSMLQGISNLISNVSFAESNSERFANMLTSDISNYIMQHFPTIFGKMANVLDDTRREYFVDKTKGGFEQFIDAAGEKVFAKIPGASQERLPYVNAWGEEEKTGPAWARALQNFISPGYWSEDKYTELTKEISRLYEITGNKNILPERAPKKIEFKGVTKNLTEDEYYNYAVMRGQRNADYLTEFILSKEYQNLTDEQRADIIEKLYKYSDAYAKSFLNYTYEDIKTMDIVDVDENTYNGYSKETKTALAKAFFLDSYGDEIKIERRGDSVVDYYVDEAIKKAKKPKKEKKKDSVNEIIKDYS